MAALVDQVKGKRQQLAPSAESLDLRAMAAAQYATTDHDTDSGRLVDHALFPGRRVRATAAELETTAADFRENFGGVAETTRFLLGTCPACQREVTHGDFGVDHIFYYLEGDEDKKPVKVRSIPRIWRGPCAERRAKQMRKPRVKSRTEKALADEWTSFVNDVNREQGHAVVEEEAAATPANAATASLWAWLAEALVGAAGAEGKVSFEVTRVDPLPGSDADARRGAFAVRLRVSYRATTALVTGEPVDAAGSSVVSLSLEPGGAAVAMATEPAPPPRAPAPPADGDVLDRRLRKVDLAAKVWAKKGAAAVVFARLGACEAALAAPPSEQGPGGSFTYTAAV
ncbi:hypothetical protein JL722_241 [Aureococcus anophagefferens]|nr:hypothetical protein JL722_241 [Aureococcus anophagefferens]